MRAWRRSTSIVTAKRKTGPKIISIVIVDDSTVAVQFDQNVFTTGSVSALTVGGQPGLWNDPSAGSTILWTNSDEPGFTVGEPWTMTDPDPSINPTPAPNQSGTIIA